MSVRVWRPTVEGVVSHDMQKSREASQKRKSYEEKESLQMDKRKRMFQADGLDVGARSVQKDQ